MSIIYTIKNALFSSHYDKKIIRINFEELQTVITRLCIQNTQTTPPYTFKNTVFDGVLNEKFCNIMSSTTTNNANTAIIINTMPPTEQHCLIKHTLPFNEEERIINKMLDNDDIRINIIVYGKNAYDKTAEAKCKQLVDLGFQHVKLYCGGMFEWLLLQDIYGEQNFPTTKKVIDILHWK